MLESCKDFLLHQSVLKSAPLEHNHYEKHTSKEHTETVIYRLVFGLMRLALVWCIAVPCLVLVWPLTLAAYLHYEVFSVKLPRLFYQSNRRNVSVLKRCPKLRRPYRPTFYTAIPMLSGHLQTFVHECLRPVPPMKFNRYVSSCMNDMSYL